MLPEGKLWCVIDIQFSKPDDLNPIAIAKGCDYPGGASTLPWARIMETPQSFFDLALLPDGVQIKDPSRMTVGPINKLFQFWLDAQIVGKEAFGFHHVWNESLERFEEASLPEAVDEEPMKTRKPKRKYKGKKEVRNLKAKAIPPTTIVDSSCSDNGPEMAGPSIQPPSPSATFERHTVEMKGKGKDKVHNDLTNVTPPPAIPISIPYYNPALMQMDAGPSSQPHKAASEVPGVIDPSVTIAYPTGGPNDPVPKGYHPVPSTFVHSGNPPIPEVVSLEKRNSRYDEEHQELLQLRERIQKMELLMQHPSECSGQPQTQEKNKVVKAERRSLKL